MAQITFKSGKVIGNKVLAERLLKRGIAISKGKPAGRPKKEIVKIPEDEEFVNKIPDDKEFIAKKRNKK